MRFAEPHGPQEDDVGVILHELEAEEVLDRHAIDLLGPAPGELVDGFDDREAGAFDAADRGAVAAQIQFPFGESGEVIDVSHGVTGGVCGSSDCSVPP